MNRQQALELAEYIHADRGRDAARAYQIASGEWIVRLKARDYWLWCPGDYAAYNQKQETENAKKKEPLAV